jgi:hypothetical protein
VTSTLDVRQGVDRSTQGSSTGLDLSDSASTSGSHSQETPHGARRRGVCRHRLEIAHDHVGTRQLAVMNRTTRRITALQRRSAAPACLPEKDTTAQDPAAPPTSIRARPSRRI